MHHKPWYSQARCLGLSASGQVEMVPAQVGREVTLAKQQCFICPVRRECHDYAMERRLAHQPEFGVWGGLTEVERDRLAAGLQLVDACEDCGMPYSGPPGYTTCDACAVEELYERVMAVESTVRQRIVANKRKAFRVAPELGLDPDALERWCEENLTWRQVAAALDAEGDKRSRRLAPCGTEAAKTRHRRELKAAGKPTSLTTLTCACRTQPPPLPSASSAGIARRNRQKNKTQTGKGRQGMAA